MAEGEALPVGCADVEFAAFGESFPGGLLHPGPRVEVGAVDGHEDSFDSVGFVGDPEAELRFIVVLTWWDRHVECFSVIAV